MPYFIAFLALIMTGYLYFHGWILVGTLSLIFAFGLVLAGKPKRSLDFDDLVQSQHTTEKQRER